MLINAALPHSRLCSSKPLLQQSLPAHSLHGLDTKQPPGPPHLDGPGLPQLRLCAALGGSPFPLRFFNDCKDCGYFGQLWGMGCTVGQLLAGRLVERLWQR